MVSSFALRGAIRYVREEHSDKELEEVIRICEALAHDLSQKKGYIHPRALAAASSHIYKTQQGISVTLETTSTTFRISTATLREYLRAFPVATTSLDSAKKILENTLYGLDLNNALSECKSLYEGLSKKKNTINPSALAAASVYMSFYKTGKAVSLTDIANNYKISTSTLRDYISAQEEGIDHMGRAKTILLQFVPSSGSQRAFETLEKVERSVKVSTARILAAIAFYLYTIDNQDYTTIEKVARQFNVSIPALRSYLEPYFPSISNAYLLFKRGRRYDVGSAIGSLSEAEREMVELIYNNFDVNIFELSLLFDIKDVPRGRWQLFIRKLAKLGLIDTYKKPLDPKQYCALVEGVREHLKKPESLQRWV